MDFEYSDKVQALLAGLSLAMGMLPEGASLYDPANIILMHHLLAGLRAHVLYFKDQHYVVQNGEVVIVDLSPNDQWSPRINGVPRGRVVSLRGRDVNIYIPGGRYRITLRGDGALRGGGAGRPERRARGACVR